MTRDIWKIGRPFFVGTIAGLVFIFGILALRDDDDGTPVWVTEAPLTIGARVSQAEPRLVTVPRGNVPDGALSAADDITTMSVAARYIPARSILTEADLAGSARSRTLGASEALINLTVPASVAQGLAIGETVDLWGLPATCDGTECAPEIVAEAARIAQVLSPETSAWKEGDEFTISVILPGKTTGMVLLSRANGSLSFVVRAEPLPSSGPSP